MAWRARKRAAKASRPFFLTDYPKGSRGFYDRENPQRPGFLRNFDLIAAEGYGELCSGSEREHEYATIVARMRERGHSHPQRHDERRIPGSRSGSRMR